jgi:hypothetical protein
MVRDTSRPRAGRRFEPTHERALHDPAVTACGSLPGAHKGVLVIREMAGPIGIPDLTALVGSPEALTARLSLDVDPLVNEIDAAVVAVASATAGRSADAISRALGWPRDTVMRRLPGLVRSGALCEIRPSLFVRPQALAPVGRLYAVEAKVRDRTAALQQARAYSVWADSYVLVMGPLAPRPLAHLREEVDADQGGLVVDGRWLRRPVIRRLTRARRLWAAEHLVAAMRGPTYQPSAAP